MSTNSKIEWTETTWNPIAGCRVVSPGCTNCYAMAKAAELVARFDQPKYRGLTRDSFAGPVWTGEIRVWEEAMLEPLKWKKPQRIFVNSMSDLFAEGVADKTIDRVFAVMALAPQHTFQVLTKRPERMRDYMRARNGMGNAALCGAINDIPARLGNRKGALEMPLPNVWLGVSVEDQRRADERIPILLDTPAAVRWISAEPLLGPVTLTKWWGFHRKGSPDWQPTIDWVVVGGESGPDARPMQIEWARQLRDQCEATGVPFFFKQWGEHWPAEKTTIGKDGEVWRTSPSGGEHWFLDELGKTDAPQVRMIRLGKKKAGRTLDGRAHDEYPIGHKAP
jgi:protein gp37